MAIATAAAAVVFPDPHLPEDEQVGTTGTDGSRAGFDRFAVAARRERILVPDVPGRSADTDIDELHLGTDGAGESPSRWRPRSGSPLPCGS